MSVNKFGTPLYGSTVDATGDTGDNDRRVETIHSLNLYVANYVRENALCLTNDRSTFDAMERKMRRVAHPVVDTDAATKRYVDAHGTYHRTYSRHYGGRHVRSGDEAIGSCNDCDKYCDGVNVFVTWRNR